MDCTWIQERIDATKAQIEALEDAALAITTGAVQAYSLDTGQSKVTVTRGNLTTLTDAVSSLYNKLATLEIGRAHV